MRTPALLLAAALLAACSAEPEAPAPAPAAAPSGERLTLTLAPLPDVQQVAATVTTRDMAEARARISGVISSLHVRAGDRVAAGQPIATITDSRLGQEAAAAGAGVAAAEAVAANARAELARIRFLHAEGVHARARLDQAVAAARAAEAQAAAARAQQGAVSAVQGQGVVRAPAAGQVLAADLPEGSAVAPGMVVATITAGPPIIRLDLPEGAAAGLQPGTPITVSGLGPEPTVARVARIHPGVSGGRVRVDAALPGLAPRLIGQRVTAGLVTGQRQGLSVPARFVEQRFGLNFARLLAADGRSAAAVPVEVRPLPDGRVEILSGLRPGDVLLPPAPRA